MNAAELNPFDQFDMPDTFPGTLYDGDGTLLAGGGPEFTLELTEGLPHKALIRDDPGVEEVAVRHRRAGDRPAPRPP